MCTAWLLAVVLLVALVIWRQSTGAHTGLSLFRWAAVALYVGLLLAWVTVAVRTFGQSVRGSLLSPPPVSPHPVAGKG